MKVGIIGYGGMAACHADNMRGYKRLEPYAVYDIDEAKLRKAEKEGMLAYDSAESLLSDGNIEVVLIATPNDSHCQYAVMAAQHAKHIICEKPAAMTVAEFDKMTEAAERNGVVLMVHQNRRWDSDFLLAKQVMQSGIIGDVYRIESSVVASNGIPGDWRKEQAKGGGMMLDWGVHLIDQLCSFLGYDLEILSCDLSYIYGCDVDDGFDLVLRFNSGITTTIRLDTNSFLPAPRWRLFGRLGSAEITNWGLQGQIVALDGNKSNKVAITKLGNGYSKTMASRNLDTIKTIDLPKLIAPADHAFYENFLLAAGKKGTPIVQNSQVKRVLEIMQNAFKIANKNYINIGENKE